MLVLDMLDFLLHVGLDQLVEQPETRVFHIPSLDNLSNFLSMNNENGRHQEVLGILLLSNPWLDW
jgi:hypothetical protein